MSGKIVKEMPGSVASGASCIIDTICSYQSLIFVNKAQNVINFLFNSQFAKRSHPMIFQWESCVNYCPATLTWTTLPIRNDLLDQLDATIMIYC